MTMWEAFSSISLGLYLLSGMWEGHYLCFKPQERRGCNVKREEME